MRPDGGVAPGASRSPGHASSAAATAEAGLEPGEVHADAGMRPLGEGQVRPGVGPRGSNVSGSGKVAGSRLAAVSDTMTRSPRRIRAPASSTSTVA